MNTLETIYNYDIIITQLIEDIKKSNFKTTYFLKLLNIKDSFFYKKMREKRFTSQEVKLLSQHLYPEQYQEFRDHLIGKLIEKSKKQLKEGKVINFEEVLKNSKQMYNV